MLTDSCVWHLYRSTSKHVQFAPGNTHSRASFQSTFNTTCKITTTHCCQETQSTVSAAFRNSIVYPEELQQRSSVFLTLISHSQSFRPYDPCLQYVRMLLYSYTCTLMDEGNNRTRKKHILFQNTATLPAWTLKTPDFFRRGKGIGQSKDKGHPRTVHEVPEEE